MMSRRATFVVYDDLQVLDLTGPHEVLSLADRILASRGGATSPAAYDIEVVARTLKRSVRTASGLTIGIDRHVDSRQAVPDEIDTLVVVGGPGARRAAADAELGAWLRAVAPRCRRVTSVCTGAFVLAAAGLLDGRRATTHWLELDNLAGEHPAVRVERGPLFVRDGAVITAAGVTAGMDLALALLEEDLGRDLALEIARVLVMFLQRPGGQSQFSPLLDAQLAERDRLRDLQGWIADHPGGDLSVPALARRAGMSPRHFARTFQEQVGVTPARYVEDVRIELARRLLESSDQPVQSVARASGFTTVETFHRSFRRRLQVSPGEYRRHFARTAPAPPAGSRGDQRD